MGTLLPAERKTRKLREKCAGVKPAINRTERLRSRIPRVYSVRYQNSGGAPPVSDRRGSLPRQRTPQPLGSCATDAAPEELRRPIYGGVGDDATSDQHGCAGAQPFAAAAGGVPA